MSSVSAIYANDLQCTRMKIAFTKIVDQYALKLLQKEEKRLVFLLPTED
jgi:hypothetical protein